MKPTPLLLLVFVLCMVTCCGQEFQKRYTNLGDDFTTNSITTTIDTGILILTIGNMQGLGPHILKLDKNGNVLQERRFRLQSSYSEEATISFRPTIIEGLDKSITVAYNGDEPSGSSNGLKILHLDSNLNLLWAKNVDKGSHSQYTNLARINSKYYAINNAKKDSVGANGALYISHGFSITGLDGNGNQTLGKKYFGEYTWMPPTNSIYSNSDKNLVICANISNDAGNTLNGYLRGTIVELDTNGNVLKAINLQNTTLNSLTQDSHENYVIMGNVLINDTSRNFISLMNKNFDVIWAKTIPHITAESRIDALVENDTIYLFTKHSEIAYLQLAITKLDYAGNAIETFFTGNKTLRYMSFTRNKNGHFVMGEMSRESNTNHYILRSSKNVSGTISCPSIKLCAPQLMDYPLTTRTVSINTANNSILDIPFTTRPTSTTVEDYCIPVGIFDASFTLARDTFCSGEQFDLISNPQLLSGESVWQITGPDNFTYVVKDTLGVKLNKAGSYTILHMHIVAFCTDSFIRNITVLGAPSNISITTCDTVRASQISNCTFTWPNGSSDSIYVATSSGTWNISTQCAVCTSNVAVQINVTPKPYLLEDAADVCEGQTLPYTLKGQHITDVLWYDGSIGLSHPFDSAGMYALMLYNNGCTQADTLAVTMLDCRTCDIYLPNAFTPNGDGNNDAFGAYTSCTQIIQFNLQIYNRWGEKVYETNDLNAVWDGTYKDQAAPAATYVYQVGISYTTTNAAESRKYKGSVMLIR